MTTHQRHTITNLLKYKVLPGIITAIILAFLTWIVTTDRRVQALESNQRSINDNLSVIRSDVRELREVFIGK